MTGEKKFRIYKNGAYFLSLLMVITGVILLLQSIDKDGLSSFFINPDNTEKQTALVRIWTPSSGIHYEFESVDRIPGNLLLEAGIRYYPGDELFWNGEKVAIDDELPPAGSYLLQYMPQIPVTINRSSEVNTIYSNAITLAGALWEAGYHFTRGDFVSIPAYSLLVKPLDIEFRKAVPLTIDVNGRELSSFSAASSVGQALADSGISLQSMDFSRPDEDQPLPEDGFIEVVRLNERIQVVERVIDFDVEKQPDPEVDSDEEWIIEPGEQGSSIAMERIETHGDEELSRTTVLEWVSKEPKTQIVGYGTRYVPPAAIGQVGGSIDYWAVKTMYATSYYPCGFKSGCSYITASGATLQKGVVALTVEMYSYLAGTQVYVPGYGVGVVADTGGGIPGTDWIDLGYGNDDYVGWSENVEVYFLNPPPAEIPWFLK